RGHPQLPRAPAAALGSVRHGDRMSPVMRHREFIATALVAPVLGRLGQARTGSARVSSPNGAIDLQLSADSARLTYSVTFRGRPVIESSPLGILVNGANLGDEVTPGKFDAYHGNDRCA